MVTQMLIIDKIKVVNINVSSPQSASTTCARPHKARKHILHS